MAERPQGLSLLSVVISLLILQYSFADEPAGILDQCKESCERSYPLHTYPKEEPLLACKQGCRFSAISQLKARVSDVGENFTLACIAGCQESYEVEENRYACVAGCKLQDQIPSPESYVEESMPDQWSFRTYMVYVYPVLDVSKYCHGFLNRVGYYYRMSTSYYYTYGDGDSIIVEVQEQPQEFISVPKFDEVDFVENDEADSSYSDDSDDSYSGAVVQKGQPIVRVLQDHIQGVTCLAFHPTNPTLFSGSSDKAVKIFDLTRPPGHKKAFSVLQDVYAVKSICIHPCGDFLFVGTTHQALRMYDLQTLSCFTTSHQDQHHTAGINDLRCTSDGKILASASADRSIKLWDAVTNSVVNALPQAHSGSSVTSVRWSRSLRYLLSSGNDGRHRLWDVRMGKEVFCMGFGPRSADFSTATFVNGERYIAAANSNVRLSDVSLFDSTTGSPVFMKMGMHTVPIYALETSPVDRTLITGCDDEKARYFSIEDK